jgi:peptidoglycan/LPS O-acetylase OafA/YrhL
MVDGDSAPGTAVNGSSEAPPAAQPVPNARMQYIHAVRGIAALFVVLFHNVEILTDKEFAHWWWVRFTPLGLVFGGTECVFVFFVLSSFVLTRRFFDNKFPLSKQLSSLAAISLRRMPRLAIPTMVSIVQAYLLNMWFNNYMQIAEYSLPLCMFYDLWIAGCPINNATWTLAWELRGSYCVWAIVLAHLLGVRNLWLIYGLVLYLFPAAPMFPFLIGCILAQLDGAGSLQVLRRSSSRATLVRLMGTLAVWGLYVVAHSWSDDHLCHMRELCFIPITALSTLVFLLVYSSDAVQRLLMNRFCDFLGDTSFAVYLVHQPILLLLGRHLDGAANWVAALTLCYTVAYAYYRLIDKPSMDFVHACVDLFFFGKPQPQSRILSGLVRLCSRSRRSLVDEGILEHSASSAAAESTAAEHARHGEQSPADAGAGACSRAGSFSVATAIELQECRRSGSSRVGEEGTGVLFGGSPQPTAGGPPDPMRWDLSSRTGARMDLNSHRRHTDDQDEERVTLLHRGEANLRDS